MLSKDLNLKGILTISLTIGALILAFSVVGLGQEDVQTSSEKAKIGYRNVGSVMSSVTGAETDKSELVKEALSNLFEELAYHMEQKGLPDHVVEKFRERTNSLETMAAEGVLTSNQIGSEASNIVKSVGRKDPEGGVPVSVLEKAGLSEKDVDELTGKGNNKEKATKAVRKMARKEDGEEAKVQSQDRAQDNTGNGNEGRPEEAGGSDNKGEGNEVAANENKGAEKGNNGNGSDKAGTSEQGEVEKAGNGNGNNNSGNDSSVADDTTNDKDNSAGQGSDKAGPPEDEEVDKEGNSDKSAGNNGNPPENSGDKDKVEEGTDDSSGPGKGNPGNGKDKPENEEENDNGRGRGSNNGKGK